MLLLIALSVVFLAMRLVNLMLLPIFADEAIYIRWAQLIWQKTYYFFIPLSDGKTPLFMWLLAPLLKLGADPLLTGRLLSVISGLATLLGVYWLTKKLFSKPLALLAGMVIVFQPFLFFYDRLSIVDSLLTALTVWSFYFTYLLLTKPSLTKGIILGLLAGAVLLTKPSGILFLILNAWLIFLFPLKSWPKKLKTFFLPGSLAIILAFSIYNLLRFSDAFHLINSRSSDYLRSSQEIIHGFRQYFLPTFKVFFSWLVNYLSWPALLMLGVSLFLAVTKPAKKILIFFIWIIIPFLIQVSIGKIIYPRYLLPLIPFVAIILSWGTIQLWQKNKLISLFLVAVIFTTWLRFDWWLLTNPALAPLDPWERGQYLQEWSAGYGLKEIKDYLNNLPQDKLVLVATEGSFGTLPDGLQIFFNQSDQIQILGVGFPDKTVIPAMEQALLSGQSVYLVVNAHRYNLSASNRLTLISEYPRPGGEKLLFYEVH